MYWKVFVHASGAIRFASKVLECSDSKIVLLLDRALPVKQRCDVRIVELLGDRVPIKSREVVFQAEVTLVVFQSMSVKVAFSVRSAGEEARKLISAPPGGRCGGGFCWTRMRWGVNCHVAC